MKLKDFIVEVISREDREDKAEGDRYDAYLDKVSKKSNYVSEKKIIVEITVGENDEPIRFTLDIDFTYDPEDTIVGYKVYKLDKIKISEDDEINKKAQDLTIDALNLIKHDYQLTGVYVTLFDDDFGIL